MSNIASIDLGNAIVQAIINGREYSMPNALALCTQSEVEYYDREQQDFFENLIVEVDSGALNNKREKLFVGISASEKENATGADKNNQKARSDRTIILALSMLAYDAVQQNQGETQISVTYDVVTTALPTRQVKKDRDALKEKLIGHHKVTFRHTPSGKDIEVKLHIVDVKVGIEGAVAFLALTRNIDTLTIKDETLTKQTILIADLGGDSLDFVGLRNGKILDGIEGVVLGINTYLDRIISAVESGIGYRFPSRYALEQVLIQGQANWKKTFRQQTYDLTPYIEPHLRELARSFLDHLDQTRNHVLLQDAEKYFCIGGAVKVARKYIEQENEKRANPMVLDFPDKLEMLNLLGLWYLAKAQAAVASEAESRG